MIKSYLRLIKLAVLLSLLLPIIVTVCSSVVHEAAVSSNMVGITVVGALSAFIVYWLLLRILRVFYKGIENISQQQAVFLDSFSMTYIDIAIFFSAAVSLLLELVVIRWQGTIFPIFAFYKNYSLLACFAGLGIGYALARRNAIPLILSFPTLTVQILLLMFLRHGIDRKYVEALWRIPFMEQLNMGVETATFSVHVIAIYAFLAVIFLLTALAFIPVGQLCGRLMTRRNNLRAYGLNLLGSILGVLLASGVSFLWTPPVIWFSLCFILLFCFYVFDRRALFVSTLFALIAVIILAWPVAPEHEAIYSPYQLIERLPDEYGLTSIRAAGHFYQRIYDLSVFNANRATDEVLQHTADYYEFPYRIYGKPLQQVAIVGAGAGNDVAAALRNGAEHVDAIEIDPAILKIGSLYHPEKPYDDSRVQSIVNDARTFMRTTDQRYDMIVYGLLDSHTLLSYASSVRLDSFVYTVEGLEEARAKLKAGGILSLSFWVLSDEIGRKIYLMMQEAFAGQPPICIRVHQGPTVFERSVIFLQSQEGTLALNETLLQQTGFEDVTAYYSNPAIRADVSTDDWPFFYMPRRVYPLSYLGMLGLILILSISLTYNFFPQKPAFSSLTFFFLGSGFMLIETKAITELGLVFGNTWHIIGIVIVSILGMAYLANLMVQRFHISRPTVPFLLLIGSLLTGFALSKFGGFDSSLSGKISSVIALTVPMFFAGIVFSTLLGRTQNIAGVMAINLLGAMVGGILEYNSMYFGFSFLYLLAIGMYALAGCSWYFKHHAPTFAGQEDIRAELRQRAPVKLNVYIVGLFFFFWISLDLVIGWYIPLERYAISLPYLLVMYVINIGIAYDLSILICASFSKGGNPPKLDQLQSTPKVALLYLCCDDAMPEALSQLNNQTYQNYEIFVLDDSSKEEDKALVDSYGYTTIRRGHRRGAKAGNLNHWLSQYGKQFEYFIVLDNGGILESTFIEEMLKYAEHPDNASVAIFQSMTKAWNTKRLFPRLMTANYPFEKLLQIRVFNQCDSMLCWGHNILCRTKPFLEIGGFDERFATEDVATNLRLIECGYQSKAVDVVSYDLASETAQFHTVRLTRWGRGTLETAISKAWDFRFATKLRMFMGAYYFSQWGFYLLGMLLVTWGYQATWEQVRILLFFAQRWNQPGIIFYPVTIILFYLVYGLLVRPIWVAKISGIPLKWYWAHGILNTAVSFYAVFYVIGGQIRSLFGKKAAFVIKQKNWYQASLWEIFKEMKWTMLVNIIIAVGLIWNPVARFVHVFWYIPLFLSPLIVYWVQNASMKNDTKGTD